MEHRGRLNFGGLTQSYTIAAILDLNRDPIRSASTTTQIWKHVNESRRTLQEMLRENLPQNGVSVPGREYLVSAPCVHEIVTRLVARGLLEHKPVDVREPGSRGRSTRGWCLTESADQELLEELDSEILAREVQLKHLRALRSAVSA